MSPPLHLSATRVAEFFRYGCERQLRYAATPPEQRGDEVPAWNSDPADGPLIAPRPGTALLAEAGRRWERRVLDRLERHWGSERVRIARGADGEVTRLPPEEVVRLLGDPGSIQLLVQPELRLPDPERFLRRFGLDPARITLLPAAPDLLRIRRREGRPHRWEVIEIKASREATLSHRAQVAFYILLLEELCRAEGITSGRPERRWGRVWTRGTRGPQRFELGAYRHHVERFLRGDLPRIAAAPPPGCEWHVAARCTGCVYLEHCRQDAEQSDDLCRVPGLTPLARRVLHGKGIRTVRDLARSFKPDTYRGCHALESGAARLRQQAQALSYGKIFAVAPHTHLLSPREDVRVMLTAEADPVTGLCFAIGVQMHGAVNSSPAVFLAESPTAAAESEMLGGVLAWLQGKLAEAADGERSKRTPTMQIYLWDRLEGSILRGLFERRLGVEEGLRAAPQVLQLLASGSAGAGRIPGAILLEAVQALWALPLPFAYDLAGVSAVLRPEGGGWEFRPPAHHRTPFNSQVAFERIHEVWRGGGKAASGAGGSLDAAGDGIRTTVTSKLRAMNSVLRAIRERAARREGLRLRPEPMASEGEPPIPDPTLESLRIFTRMEAAADALAVRALHLLPAEERARRFECIREMNLLERRPDGALVFEFDPECRDVKFRPGDFTLVLTNDDDHALPETDRLFWKQWDLRVTLVDFDLSVSPPRVVLEPGSGFARAEEKGWIDLGRVCVLDRALVDYTSDRVVTTLRQLTGGRDEAAFVRGLLDGVIPPDWKCGWRSVDEAWRDTLGGASRRMGRPVLNPEQEHAWRAALQQPLSLIWGPPGTGKTYLLAWILIGIADAARREGRPCRILVAAATHRAIVNVLVRTAATREAAGLDLPLRIVKLRGSGNAADDELAGTGVERCLDEQLPSLLDATGTEPLVIGGTVWSLWKQMKRAANGDTEEEAEIPMQPWFDVVVVDEASQIPVAEALIALSAVRSGGQVILAGDDRQLAPVRRSGGGEGGTTLFSSIFVHLAQHFDRLSLRETRRLNPGLVRYPRQLFYPGLRSRSADRIRLAPAPDAEDPLDSLVAQVFLDPADAVVLCTYGGLSPDLTPQSRAHQGSPETAPSGHLSAVGSAQRNPFEAVLSARIARIARGRMLDPDTGDLYTSGRFVSHGFAVISPHRAQNSAILAELLATGFSREELPVVDTVERMQGNERQLILVSYGVADREYAEAEAEFLLDPRRFNVSITRPSAKLIVLLSEAVLSALPRDADVLAASAAIKGYPAHCADGVRDVTLPAPGGGSVQARCHYLTLGG